MAARRRRRPTHGDRFAKFAATYCTHQKGFRGPIIFEPWQRFAFDLAFELDPKTGLRTFNEVVFGWPRGQSKSTSCAVAGLYLLVADDEPGPEIISAAGKKAKAKEVHDVAKAMARRNDALDDLLDVQADRILLAGDQDADGEPPGKWEIITSNGELEQGSNPSGAIVDELHTHRNGSTYNAIQSGALTKRKQPLLFSITTAGSRKDTFCGSVYDQMLRAPIVERPNPYTQVAIDRDNGKLMVWHGLPDDLVATADLEDPAIWKGCNPASWITPKALRSLRAGNGMDQETFLRFHLNGWRQRLGAGGIPAALFDACAATELYEQHPELGPVLPEGTEVVVGVDAGWSDDWTVVVAVGRVAGRLLAEAHFFPPEDGRDVDLDTAIRGTILGLSRRLRIREVVADPSGIPDVIQSLGREGFHVWKWQNSALKVRIDASLGLWRSMRSGEFGHAEDPDLRTHFLNARKADGRMGDWYFDKPLKDGSNTAIDRTLKIDGLAATLMAHYRFGCTRENDYEEGDLFSF